MIPWLIGALLGFAVVFLILWASGMLGGPFTPQTFEDFKTAAAWFGKGFLQFAGWAAALLFDGFKQVAAVVGAKFVPVDPTTTVKGFAYPVEIAKTVAAMGGSGGFVYLLLVVLQGVQDVLPFIIPNPILVAPFVALLTGAIHLLQHLGTGTAQAITPEAVQALSAPLVAFSPNEHGVNDVAGPGCATGLVEIRPLDHPAS